MSDATIICGSCGASNPHDAQFCATCGALLAAYVSPHGSLATDEPPPNDGTPPPVSTDDRADTTPQPLADAPLPPPSAGTPSGEGIDEEAEPDLSVADERELPAELQPAWSPTEIIDIPFSDRSASEPGDAAPPDAPPLSATAEPPAPTPPMPEHRSAPGPPAPAPPARPIAPQAPSAPRPRPSVQPTPRWPTAPQQSAAAGGQKGPLPYPAAKSPPQLMVVVGISVILGSCLLGLASAAIDLPTLLDALVWCGSIGGIICLAVGIVGLANQRSGRRR